MRNGKTKLILAEGTDAVVLRGGIRIEFNANGAVDVYAPVPVTLHPAANACPGPRAGDSPAPPAKPQAKSGPTPHRRWYPLRRPQIGDEMPDGTICAGISPDTGKPFYVDEADAPGTYTFDQARDYAASQRKRVPTKPS